MSKQAPISRFDSRNKQGEGTKKGYPKPASPFRQNYFPIQVIPREQLIARLQTDNCFDDGSNEEFEIPPNLPPTTIKSNHGSSLASPGSSIIGSTDRVVIFKSHHYNTIPNRLKKPVKEHKGQEKKETTGEPKERRGANQLPQQTTPTLTTSIFGDRPQFTEAEMRCLEERMNAPGRTKTKIIKQTTNEYNRNMDEARKELYGRKRWEFPPTR